ncbi:FixH family protein [Agaribacterium haliotis]|uniref:FixH family protein n=1 Tax=Agaribacterium haliotis TaxID=2013869 RepID=UPI000BB58FB9|nr:FixH family protein [Agaribacterium haliotis]
MIKDEIHEGPWYKQFWAWFILTPLLVVIAASSVMVTIAFKQKQDVVSDDYYKIGKMINQSFDSQQAAKALGLNAELYFDKTAIVLSASGKEAIADDDLLLFLSHPVDAKRDHYLTLIRSGENTWQVNLKQALSGRWYLRLSSLDDAGIERWRMQGEIDLGNAARATLH